MPKKIRRLISKKVRVIDCNCSSRSKQVEADRFDDCVCKVRVEKGRKRGLEQEPTKYQMMTVFIAAHPKKVWK